MVKWLGYKSLLTTTGEFVPTKNREQWIKIDNQLHSVIKYTIHISNLFFIPMRCVYQFGVRPAPFIPVMQCLCGVYQDLLTVRHFKGPIFAYLGWLHATLHDFSVLLPPSANVKKDFDNHNMFFMTLGLYGFPHA